MRCRFCGLQLEERLDTCPRCHADLTLKTRLHELRISLIYFAICLVLVSLLVFVVLR